MKLTDKSANKNMIFIGLVVLMAISRVNHFGSISSLPDASLAVFFFAGLYLRRWWVLPSLLLEAGLIDFFVTSVGGVSSYCITPAYLFLIPTYLVIWVGGRVCSDLSRTALIPVVQILLTVCVVTSLAFVISNLGFYEFSGRFEVMELREYMSKVVQYFPVYLSTTLFYSVILLTMDALNSVLTDKVRFSYSGS